MPSYERFRVSVGHFGIIAGGIAFAALSFFIRTDIFEAILDFVGVLGMTAGIAVSGAGVFMLGLI